MTRDGVESYTARGGSYRAKVAAEVMSWASESGQVAAISNAHWNAWGALAFNVLGASLLAHTGYFYLVQRYPVTSSVTDSAPKSAPGSSTA